MKVNHNRIGSQIHFPWLSLKYDSVCESHTKILTAPMWCNESN